ncbi:hypothetical protein Tco_0750737 [Tanacetum coccineum]|uniref:Uncharacterized protein n=1 Tax=Tanacetum coccineum TaxID=301880 RepID=A0ABQ4Z4P1_9ASTR
MPTDPHHTPTIIPPSTLQPQRKQRPRKLKTKDTEIPQSSVVRAEQDRDDEATLGDQEDASKQGRKIDDIDADNDIILDSTHFDTDPDMFGMLDLDSDEVFVETKEPVVNAATTTRIISDKVETDYELAQRLQVEEQEELTIEEKSKLFQELLEKRRKHFAAKRAEERRNRPPTKAQQRSIMCTYLKNMAGWKPKDLKTNKTREESSSKRAGDELEQEPLKKQKVDDDKETEELKQYGNSQMYLTFGKMLKNFDREDLEVLWSIVKERFKKTEPMNYMDTFLHLNLKTIFENHLEDNVWKNQQGLVKVLNWKHYDSYGVHCVTMQNILYYLLVEKMYPLTKHKLHQMFNDVKLQVDYECEMAFELLRLVKKQVKEGYVPQ